MDTVSEKILAPFFAMILLFSMAVNVAPQQILGFQSSSVNGIWEDLFGSNSDDVLDVVTSKTPSGSIRMYLQITGIDGESTHIDHREWIDVLSFNMGMSQPWDGAYGIGQIIMEDIALVKQVDKATPKLMEKCAKGEVIPSVVLELSVLGTETFTFYKYELKNVIVSSFFSSGNRGDNLPTETITLHFEWFKVTYTEKDATGNTKGTVELTWDTVTGRIG